MRISAIYPTYQGEVNVHGIGSPVIFVRTAGCHLRCYLHTLGNLCDTPEALSKDSGSEMTIDEIVSTVNSISNSTGGIKLVCLSGGDPLAFRTEEELSELFCKLGDAGYLISVETSGTKSMQPFAKYKWVHWVLDYKLSSAGVKPKFVTTDLNWLTDNDYIKFVIYNEDDYNQFFALFEALRTQTRAKIAVGVYWNGFMENSELVKLLSQDQLLGKVVINFQVHKMATLHDNVEQSIITDITIPREI